MSNSDWSDMILQYKVSVIDKLKDPSECNLPCVDLATHYTEPVIIQRSKEQYYRDHVRSVHPSGSKPSSHLLTNYKNHSIRIDQLFSPDSDGNTPKSVILSGDSGRGKSIMLQKIMLDWASGELYSKFDVVFLLKCEELKCISEEMSLSELLSWSCSLTSDQISQILDLTPEKVLILIDGFDEYVSNPSSHLMFILTDPSKRAPPVVILRNLLRGILLPESFLLVTTRSDAGTVMKLLKGPQRFTEIVGFSERGVQEYFQKFFQDEQLFRKTYESVKTNETLLIACSVPLLCWMVCFCLKKHFTDDDPVMRELKTTTSIYVHFVSTLLEHHDQSQSVLTMLRCLGQRAEEGMKRRQGLYLEKSVTATGLDPASTVFLYKDSLKKNNRQVPVFKFMHLSFQEFFTGLYYVLLDEKESWGKVTELLTLINLKGTINRPSPERRSVMMFLCGLLNEKVSCSLFEKIKWTVPHTIKLKETLLESVLSVRRQPGCELFALHCLYELHDEEFVRRALGDWVSMNLSNVSLKSTDCWVLLYCLQCCPHIRDLDLMYCDLTAEKLKILQPVLCISKTLRLSVEHLSEVGDLILVLGESKTLRDLKVQEDENSAESPIWSLNQSVAREDVLLSLSSSEKNPSFLLNISLKCPQSEISTTDWTLFLQRLCMARKKAEDSSALDDYVSLLLSSFHSVGLKTVDLKLVSLNESWASGIISLVQTCTSLQLLSVCAGVLSEEVIMLLNKSLTDPHCTVIIEGRKCRKPSDHGKEQDCSHSCYEKVKIHFKTKVLEEQKKITISEPGPSGLNLQPLPVCQSCVHIVDSDQWVQVEPSVCTNEGGSEFRISTLAGRFECSRTRIRWVCAGDVTLQYRAVDGGFLREELERLQCERIGPVLDVTVISGKLEEAHLPHYVCLAESSLKDAVKVLSIKNEVVILESAELTRFHAKILQPSFWPTTVIKEKGIPVEQHLDLHMFITNEDPLILHAYFFPRFDLFSKEKIEQEEKANNPHVLEIEHPSPSMKIQLNTPHFLKVSGGSVLPEEEITFLGNIHPVFFKIKQDINRDIQMTLIKQQDESFVWKTIIWKDKLNQKKEMRELMTRYVKPDIFDSGITYIKVLSWRANALHSLALTLIKN